MSRRVKKKRSLRGKLLLSVVYLVLCCLIIIAMRPIVTMLSNNDDVDVVQNENTFSSSEHISNNHQNSQEIVSFEKEQFLVSSLLNIVKEIPYAKDGVWDVTNKGEIISGGIDTYGLVELSYYITNNKHLKDIGIYQDNIYECEEVSSKELKIGDVGINMLPGGNIYGIYVGNFGSYPLFVYASNLPNKDHKEGSIYLSYDKNACNDLFAGMYPVPYDMFVRLPGMTYKSDVEIDIASLLPEKAIPPQYYHEYALAIYRIGELLRTKDSTTLINRMDTSVLELNDLYLDENVFKDYVDSYNENVGYDDYVFIIDGFTEFDNHVIVSSEIVVLNDDVEYEKTGIYFSSTFYEDGGYLPAPESAIGKYAQLYGFKRLNHDKTGEDKDINTYEEYGFIVDLSTLFEDTDVSDE